MKMKICIDAGHGGADSGAVGIGGRMEKDDNLKTATALGQEMIRRGHTAMMTRTGDTYPSLSARASFANQNGADVFVSCHENSFSDPASNGFETLYSPKASKTSIALAQEVQKRVAQVGGRNRGAKAQNATVLNSTNMPAVTIELGFITNVNDMALVDGRRAEYVCAIADALEAVLGKGGADVPKPQPAPADPYAYKTAKETEFFRYSGKTPAGTKVTLLSHYEGCNVANVRFADGATGFVLWSDIEKA
jgi:N-acetylmuramoyl-L-alanine amidase